MIFFKTVILAFLAVICINRLFAKTTKYFPKGLNLIKMSDAIYVISKDSPLKIDVASQKAEVLTEKIKLARKGDFSSLEILWDNIIIGSNQETVGTDKQTEKINFNIDYKAPRAGLATIAGNIFLAAVAMTAPKNSYSVVSNSGSSAFNQYTPELLSDGGSNTVDDGIFPYLSSKFNESGAKRFGLAKVDQFIGKIFDKRVVVDRNPIYDMDDTRGVIFIQSGGQSIKA